MRNLGWLFLPILLIPTAIAVWMQFFTTPAEIEFRALSRPEGFRALAVAGLISGAGAGRALTGIGESDRAPPPEGEALCAALNDGPRLPPGPLAAGAVRIYSFSDYRCPYCRVLSGILDDLIEEGEAQVVFKDWPLLGPASELGARAALAADMQGRYMEMHRKLMGSAFVPNPAYLKSAAPGLGIDPDRLARDMQDPQAGAAIDRSLTLTSEAARAFGLVGTPSLIVGRTVAVGAIRRAELLALIEAERAAGPAPCGTA